MEKQFAKRGIETVLCGLGPNEYRHFVFTRSMLKRRIYIELEQSLKVVGGHQATQSKIHVFTFYGTDAFEFTLLDDVQLVTSKLFLFRLMLDAIELITGCKDNELLTEIHQFALSKSLTTDYADVNTKKKVADAIIGKEQVVLELYKDKNRRGG